MKAYSVANLGMSDDVCRVMIFIYLCVHVSSFAVIGKKRILTQEEEADEPYSDISTILGMLSSVMASEFEGYGEYNLTI